MAVGTLTTLYDQPEQPCMYCTLRSTTHMQLPLVYFFMEAEWRLRVVLSVLAAMDNGDGWLVACWGPMYSPFSTNMSPFKQFREQPTPMEHEGGLDGKQR